MEAVKPLQLLEIERELSGPDRRDALRRHDAVLAALENRISQSMESGMSPDEFSMVERLREANTIARKLLRLAVKEADGA